MWLLCKQNKKGVSENVLNALNQSLIDHITAVFAAIVFLKWIIIVRGLITVLDGQIKNFSSYSYAGSSFLLSSLPSFVLWI
mmetsp:Transcript_12681/g.17060  ORF Transcript_12681/g.17060 Transcript_12681/m.17060 type:complete len:81 (-) Transcript_12681:533-775(-)